MRRAMAAAMHTEAKIAELGLKLPSHPRPVAAYVMCQRVGNIIYTAGSCHAQQADRWPWRAPQISMLQVTFLSPQRDR